MSSVKLRKEKDCLNCGHVVEENFCPKCGQENIVTKEDAFHMVTHAIADYFHFEHKFFGTVKPLLLKPGQLTKEYVAGKRMSSIHPIRLYIFISIVFFLVILSGKGEKHEAVKESKKTTVAAKGLTVQQTEELNDLKEGLKYIPISKEKKDSIINVAIEDIKKNGSTNIDLYTGETKAKTKSGWTSKFLSKDTTVADYEKHQAALAKDKRDGFIKHYFTKRSIELNKYPDPQQKFMEDFLHNIPKMMFLLLPLFALILKLVYINKKRYYYEHLIYSFHVHSAMFLSVLLTMLLSWLIGFAFDISDWLGIICFFYMLWYIYRSLRTFYGSTRWITLLKMFFLFFLYNIILTICFLVVIAVSFITI